MPYSSIVIQTTEALHAIIVKELELIIDIIGNTASDIRKTLSIVPTHLDKKEEAIISKIYEILSKLAQPATLLQEAQKNIEEQTFLNENQELAEQPADSSSSNEASASRQSIQPTLQHPGSARLSRVYLRPEYLIKNIVTDIEKILPALVGNYFSKLTPLLANISNFYKTFLTQWRTASEIQRKQLQEPLVVVSLKTAENSHYLMPQKLARQILSRDLHGYLRKTNSSGNHAVSISKDLVKKGSLEKGELDPILPGMEKIVVSFCNLLGESLLEDTLTAPTTLIKLDQIVFYKVHQQLSDAAQLAQFNTQSRETTTAPEVLISNLPNLVTFPEEIGAFIQVGKTLHGWSLHDLLNLLWKFNLAQKVLSEDQLQLFIASQFALEDQSYYAITNALSPHFPKEDLDAFCKLLKKLPELFPNQTVAQMIIDLPKMIELFDANNYTALLIMSLLTNPCDGKADNYLVEFDRNAQQKITAIKIKGIDNDQALADSIVSVKTMRKVFSEQTNKDEYKTVALHFAGIKCVLYSLPMLRQPASQAVINSFLRLSPEILILRWLIELHNDDQDYIRFLKNKPSELDIPVRLETAHILKMYDRICFLQKFIKSHNGQLTNQQIFSEIEPLLSCFYEKILTEQNGDPLLTQSRIYHGNGLPCPTMEETLNAELDQRHVMHGIHKITWREKLETYNRTEHYYKYRTQTVQDVVEKFIKHIDLVSFIYDEAKLWPILRLLAQFNFLTRLPLDDVLIEKLFPVAITKGEAAIVSLLLGCEQLKKPNLIYPLHLAVQQPQPSIDTITALLKNKKINATIFDTKGDTALSLANPDNEVLISLLIASGIDIDSPQIATGKTLIEKTIDDNRPESFIKLVSKGAGKKLNARKALHFIYQHQSNSALQTTMQQALDVLSTQNPEIATLAMLNAITQETNPTQNLLPVDILGTQGIERRFIKPEAMSKIFDMAPDGNIKGIKRSNVYGRRAVAFVEHDRQKMHIKSHPEIFATEEGVKILWRMLFQQGGIAESLVMSVGNKQLGDAYPVLISRHVEGDNLQPVVQDLGRAKEIADLLDARRFSEVLIMTMLINPEDDKPDNKILRSFINKEGIRKLEIVGIDNDHAFVFPLSMKDGHRILQVKTIVACLDQMREPLHPEVREIILNLSPNDLLDKWLKTIEKRQQWADQLFPETARQRFFNDKDPILTRMPLPRGMIAHMYGTLERMKQVLKKQPNISQINFLCLVEPSFIAYKLVMETTPNPGARFHELFQRQYSSLVVDRFETIVTGKQILQSAKIPDKDMISNTITYGPSQALYELTLVAAENAKLIQVKQQLLQGKVTLFKELLLSSSRAAILKEVSLKDLPADSRTILLKTLQNIPLEYLDLNDCSDISSNVLKPILESSPNLLALNLSGCEKITVDILTVIAKNCNALKKLYLNNLPWSVIAARDKPIEFPNLQRLWINGAPNLKEVKLHAPKLQWWSLRMAPNLKLIQLQGQSLRYLSLEGSEQIAPEILYDLLGQSPQLLKTMQLKGNFILPPRFLTWLNAAYGLKQWQADNLPRMIKTNLMILQGLKINDFDLEPITYFGRNIKHIDLVGVSNVSWRGVSILLNKLHRLETIRKTDYTEILPKNTEIKMVDCIDGFALGYAGILYSISRAGKTRIHHLGNVEYHVEEIPDNNKTAIAAICAIHSWVFIGTRDGVIKVWNTARQTYITEFRAHSYPVKALQYSPEKNILISVSEDKTIKFWDIYTGKAIKSISTRAKINALELFDDYLVVGFETGGLGKFDYRTGEQLSIVNLHPSAITALKKISDRLVMTASSDYTAKIYDVKSEDCINTLAGHERAVTAIEALQGNLVATGSLDKTIKLWDVLTGECLTTLSGHERKITALQLVENKLVSASEDNTLRIWEFPIKEILFDIIPRRAKMLELTQQEALLTLKINHSRNQAGIMKFCVDFIMQFLSSSGIGVNQNIDKGEIIFSVNNKNKYVALAHLLTNLTDFIERSFLIDTAAVKKPEAAARSASPAFWRSARPSLGETEAPPRFKEQQTRTQSFLYIQAAQSSNSTSQSSYDFNSLKPGN